MAFLSLAISWGALPRISARDREFAALTDEAARKEEWWKMRLDKEKERYNALKEQFDRLGELKEKLTGTDFDAIKAATEKLSTVSQALGQRLYDEAAKKNQENPEASNAQANDEEIVDAEIVE